MNPPAWRLAALATLLVGGAAALALAGVESGAAWASLAPADCAEYCEASHRCGPPATRAAVQQPLNSWSNLAFLFVGGLALRRPREPLSILFALSCAVLAVGSFLFHATVTREMQWLDMVGTYAVLVAVAARGAAVSFELAVAPVLAVALVADALFAIFKWSISANVALPLLMVAASIPITRRVMLGEGSVRGALVPVGLFALALALRQLDVAHVACDPEGLYQGHALWHLLTAASLGLWFFFFDAAPEHA